LYLQEHAFYCGVDLHARSLHVCIVDQSGRKLVHQNIDADPERFLALVRPYRQDLVVACECMFAWYWLADLCAAEGLAFILGHALYMKAIHGGKTKNDRIDSEKIARLVRGGNFPLAYAYPAAMRSTRDLLRRRMQLVRLRAEAIAHVTNTTSQYNLPALEKKLSYAANREGVAELFTHGGCDESVRRMVESDLALADHLDEQRRAIELYLKQHARIDDPLVYQLLQTAPGIGPMLALVLLYELHDIRRFARVGQFVSYCRLVRCAHESNGKKSSSPGKKKIGNAQLRWAFGEAACLMLRELPEAKRYVTRLEKKHGKAKALSILSARLARTVYWMLKRKEAFDAKRFLK
jgi:transposase